MKHLLELSPRWTNVFYPAVDASYITGQVQVYQDTAYAYRGGGTLHWKLYALYPASGKLRINDEVMSFTRSGDALTLSGRGSNFTTAAAHEANDAVQPCYVATGLALHAILYDLLVNYAGVPAAVDSFRTAGEIFAELDES